MSKIHVDGVDITIISQNDNDYVNLTEIVSKFPDGSKLIERWLNTKNTVDFLGVWEQLYNPDFNSPEFRGIRENAGSPSYYLSVKKWIMSTNAIGINAKSGRYGGTYAQKDIAFEFASYIDPYFKLLLIKEFQRLKDEENKRLNSEWDYRRFLAKTNWTIHTDAIKNYVLPKLSIEKDKEKWIYTEEADLLNVAMFGCTAKQWREANPALHLKGLNIRDIADAHQLLVLSNLESINAAMMQTQTDKYKRLLRLKKYAEAQLKTLKSSPYTIEKIQSPFLQRKKTGPELNSKALPPEKDKE
jgi:hypothetical protein